MDKFVTGLRIKHSKSAELSVTVGQAEKLQKKNKISGFFQCFGSPRPTTCCMTFHNNQKAAGGGSQQSEKCCHQLVNHPKITAVSMLLSQSKRNTGSKTNVREVRCLSGRLKCEKGVGRFLLSQILPFVLNKKVNLPISGLIVLDRQRGCLNTFKVTLQLQFHKNEQVHTYSNVCSTKADGGVPYLIHLSLGLLEAPVA